MLKSDKWKEMDGKEAVRQEVVEEGGERNASL
jgi:hypothetical protein